MNATPHLSRATAGEVFFLVSWVCNCVYLFVMGKRTKLSSQDLQNILLLVLKLYC